MTLKCASWIIYLVAALAVSRWTSWCLQSCSVPMSDVFDLVSANRLDFNRLSPGWSGCVSMICWCGIEKEDDNKKKWEFLKTILLALCQNGISCGQDVSNTQDKFCCTWLQVAGVSYRPAMCNTLGPWCLDVNRDKLWCSTAEIA